MFNQEQLDAAVAAGALPADEAAALRDFIDQRRASPAVDEEEFRLVTSFNDIFVTIAILITAYAATALLGGWSMIGLAALGWFLSVPFVRRRRMALPGIVLAIMFVLSVAGQVGAMTDTAFAATLAALAAAYAHWGTFRVPVTVAAGCWAVVIAIVQTRDGQQLFEVGTLGLLLACGIGVFALAMWWDMRDPRRVTRSSDVAFWLHLQASPLIIHSAFWLSGLPKLSMTSGGAALILGLYGLIAMLAVLIDRRAMLVSAMAYALWALGQLVYRTGDLSVTFPATLLIIGSLLLLLSAFWHRVRRTLVSPLPAGVRRFLPALDRLSPAPAA